jgi:hypothetical protein
VTSVLAQPQYFTMYWSHHQAFQLHVFHTVYGVRNTGCPQISKNLPPEAFSTSYKRGAHHMRPPSSPPLIYLPKDQLEEVDVLILCTVRTTGHARPSSHSRNFLVTSIHPLEIQHKIWQTADFILKIPLQGFCQKNLFRVWWVRRRCEVRGGVRGLPLIKL